MNRDDNSKFHPFSPAHSIPLLSSCSGDLPLEMMESQSPPLASPPPRADDVEVSSHMPSLNLEWTRGGDLMTQKGNTLVAEGLGVQPPWRPVTKAPVNLTPRRVLLRRPTRLWGLVSDPLQDRGER